LIRGVSMFDFIRSKNWVKVFSFRSRRTVRQAHWVLRRARNFLREAARFPDLAR